MSTIEETAESLVDQLVASGGWPEPRLCAAILAKGSEAVAPLRTVLHLDPAGGPESGAVDVAAWLLGDLRDPAAIPDLLNLLRLYDDDVVEAVRESLGRFGKEVIEPLLAIGRDPSLGWYPRSTAFDTAINAAGDDLPARAMIAEVMRDLLAEAARKGDSADDRDSDIATWMVYGLSNLADPLARELIDSAFQADLVDTSVIEPNDVDDLYRQGGAKSDTQEREPFLNWYERRYQEELESKQQLAEYEERQRQRREESKRVRASTPPAASRPMAPPMPMPTSPEPIRNTEWRPRRNDPCWCGSGKKYKNCHLRADKGQK
jgi:hypothetical protein